MDIKKLLKEYKYQFAFTLFLVLSEAGIEILFPLFIGYAIDGAIHQTYWGAIQLGLLGLVSLIVGLVRRVFDTRFYAKIYRRLGSSIITHMQDKPASVRSARLGMIRELIEFLENSFPELVSNVIGLLGVIILIFVLNRYVFYGSILITFVVFLIYWISSLKTIQLNKAANDELEKQVDVISSNDEKALNHHLQAMMKWNIKLSNLEAVNFSFTWIILILFLVSAIMISVNQGITKYGALFSLIMYVFQYIENVIHLPLYYQHWLRLKEIKDRIENI